MASCVVHDTREEREAVPGSPGGAGCRPWRARIGVGRPRPAHGVGWLSFGLQWAGPAVIPVAWQGREDNGEAIHGAWGGREAAPVAPGEQEAVPDAPG